MYRKSIKCLVTPELSHSLLVYIQIKYKIITKIFKYHSFIFSQSNTNYKQQREYF